jgi:hypothetical protein
MSLEHIYKDELLKFGTTTNPTAKLIDPIDFSVEIKDIDKSIARDAKGNIVRKYLTTKRTLNCKWGFLSESQSATLLSYFNSATNPTFYLSYPDPQLGRVVKRFYVSEKSVPMFQYRLEGSTYKGYWEGIELTLEEV